MVDIGNTVKSKKNDHKCELGKWHVLSLQLYVNSCFKITLQSK